MNSQKNNNPSMSVIEKLCVYHHLNINIRMRNKIVSEKMAILCDVELSLIDDDTEESLFTILGTLKQFTMSGNVQLDFSNTINQKYKKSGIGESIANVVSDEFIKKIFDNMEENEIGILDTAFKIENYGIVWVQKQKNKQADSWADQAMEHANRKLKKLPPLPPPEEEPSTENPPENQTDESVRDIMNQ